MHIAVIRKIQQPSRRTHQNIAVPSLHVFQLFGVVHPTHQRVNVQAGMARQLHRVFGNLQCQLAGWRQYHRSSLTDKALTFNRVIDQVGDNIE